MAIVSKVKFYNVNRDVNNNCPGSVSFSQLTLDIILHLKCKNGGRETYYDSF